MLETRTLLEEKVDRLGMYAPRATEVLSPPVLIVQGVKLRNNLKMGERYERMHGNYFHGHYVKEFLFLHAYRNIFKIHILMHGRKKTWRKR